MIPNLELTILRAFIHNEDFTRKVLPYVKDEYFETAASRTIFSLCSKYFTKYSGCPTREALVIGTEGLEGVSEEEFRSIGGNTSPSI